MDFVFRALDFLVAFIRERLADGGPVDWLILVSLAACVVGIPVVAAALFGPDLLARLGGGRADTPPTPVPVPQRSGSPFAPKWLTERNARILAEREARRG